MPSAATVASRGRAGTVALRESGRGYLRPERGRGLARLPSLNATAPDPDGTWGYDRDQVWEAFATLHECCDDPDCRLAPWLAWEEGEEADDVQRDGGR
jgi:hypothetical protein